MASLPLQAAVLLGTALVAVPAATRIGLGSPLGYLIAGVAIGPVLHVLGATAEDLRHLGEYGVVVMLFLIGLELDPRALWRLRHRLAGLGSAQIGLTAAAFGLGAAALGQPWPAAVTLGLALSLSSTAMVLQTLAERRLLGTPGGRAGFAVLLAQDIAVVPMLAALPLLAAGAAGGGAAAGTGGGPVADWPAPAAALLTLGAVAAVVLTGLFLTRPAFRCVGRSRLREMHTALALFIVLATTALMEAVGLSAALGSFLAGVILARTDVRHEVDSDLQPFKGLLLGLFFLSIGAGMDTALLLSEPLAFAALLVAVMGTKAAILLALGRVAGLPPRDRRVLALGLSQAGECGFVIAASALALGVLDGRAAQGLTLLIALSMLATPLMFLWAGRGGMAEEAPPEGAGGAAVVVAGAGRFGRTVHRLLSGAGQEVVVLDTDLAAVEAVRARGGLAWLGDAARPEVLETAGIDRARVLVVAFDDPRASVRLVRMARRRRQDLVIVARARDREHAYALIRAGADEVLRETFDSALRAGRHALGALGTGPEEADAAERAFARHERAALRELAWLWEEEQAPRDRAAYLARARALDEDLEARLTARQPPGAEGGAS